MMILVWFVVCIIFFLVQIILGNSGHALEVFALLTAIALFLISKLKKKIRIDILVFFFKLILTLCNIMLTDI